ncbi:MAG: hypothetical protein IT380_09370 [Myxococcales bacterium]|nr:hypothetical protein [Myxococcales bacterium]
MAGEKELPGPGGFWSSPSGLGSSPSGFYVSRPSIARYIEAAALSVMSAAGHVVVRLDVLSEHQLYLAADDAVRGVFVVTAAPGGLGAPVNLDIELPWGETMTVAGDVDWVLDVPRASLRHRPGMGVRLELLPEQQVLLQRALLLREPFSVPPNVRRR